MAPGRVSRVIGATRTKSEVTTRQLKPYPAHKDSGVDWLGEIPVHWEVKKWRYCCHVTEGQVAPDDAGYRDRIMIAPNHIESATGRILFTETADQQGAISGKYLVKPGDLIYSKIRPALNKACIAAGDWLCSADMYPVKVIARDLRARYLLYFVLSEPFVRLMVDESMRVAMPKVNREKLSSCPLLIPAPFEQDSIVAFLDRETARIDALVAKKERLIELLQEKRTALIARAVTKGLEPNVPMKDSGVEWLGEIPAHWGVKRVKNLACFVTSGSRGWAEHYADDGPVFLRIGNLSPGTIDLNLTDIQHVQPPAGAEGERTRIRGGDVLISITALIGAVGVVPDGIPKAFVNQHLALVRPEPGRIESRWLGYCALSRVGQQQMSADLYGGTKDGLGLDDIRSLIMLLPPHDEQKEIVEMLDVETRETEDLVLKIRDAIDRLKEFRTALISGAVTGKIDVRGEAGS
jgi:type I restriction enzyme, S subunit